MYLFFVRKHFITCKLNFALLENNIMSKKFHVNAAGEPGVCHAKNGGCPFGDVNEHYDSMDDARQAYEKKMSALKETLMTPMRKPIRNVSSSSYDFYDAMLNKNQKEFLTSIGETVTNNDPDSSTFDDKVTMFTSEMWDALDNVSRQGRISIENMELISNQIQGFEDKVQSIYDDRDYDDTGRMTSINYFHEQLIKNFKSKLEPAKKASSNKNEKENENDLEQIIKAKFEGKPNSYLTGRMNRAGDFNYDDEAHELSRRLKKANKSWIWSTKNTSGEKKVKILDFPVGERKPLLDGYFERNIIESTDILLKTINKNRKEGTISAKEQKELKQKVLDFNDQVQKKYDELKPGDNHTLKEMEIKDDLNSLIKNIILKY